MSYKVCPQCPPTGEWHFQHRDEVTMQTVYTRADLVRAILGQQWAVAIVLHSRAMILESGLGHLPSPEDVVTAMEQA